MACVGALLLQAVFLFLPIRVSGSEFLGNVVQKNSSSNSSSELGLPADPEESLADLVEIPGLDTANGSIAESSSLQMTVFSATEAAVQGSGQHFYAQVCAALNCRKGLPLSHVRSFGEAAVGKSGGTCVVAFRGTANVAGVLEDVGSFSLVPFSCSGCRVGAGFKSGYYAVAGQIKGALHSLGCHSVAVTGHSLGAAKAILCMYDLAKSGFHITTSYVFGEPRVGNSVFRDSFHSVVHASVFQVVHGKDPIVTSGGPGAHHVGSEIYEPGNSRLTDHLHYEGVDMSKCTPDGVPGGSAAEKRGEKAVRAAESAAQCCLHFKWSCCIHR